MNLRTFLTLVAALFATAAGVSAQPIQITSQPSGIVIAQGQPRPIVVQATGGVPISYQWLRLDGGVFPAGTTGINSNAVVVGPATTAAVGVYYCILSNSAGSVTSAPAGLFMSLPGAPSAVATVTANPLGQTAVAGTNVFLTAAGYGNGPLTLQWRGRTNAVGSPTAFADIVGATNASLVLSNVQQDASYVLRIDNGLAFPAATAVANVTVVRAPTVATNPVGLAVAIGSNVTFTGAINGGLIGYQWLKAGVPIGGETNSSLAFTVTNVSNAGGYALVGNNQAGSVTSTVAQLTVVLPPTITTAPSSISVSALDSASFSASASSATTMTFRWFINGNLMQTTTGNANSTFNVLNLLSGGNLVAGLATNVPAPVHFSASNIAGVATAPATIVVTPLPIRPIITLQPLGVQVAQGQTRAIVVQATGGGAITYTWLRRDGGLLPAGSTGTNAASLTVPTSTTSAVGVYYCVVANSAGSVTSAPAGLFMSLPGAPSAVATVTDNPQSQTAVADSTVFLTAAGYGNGTLRLQWRGRTNAAVPFADVLGATNGSLILSNVQESASYVLRIDNGLAFPAATTVANITVVRAPTVATNPVSLAVAIGGNATFSGAIDGGLIGYRWLKDGVPIAGQTGSVLAFTATNVSNAGGYSLVGSNQAGSVTSTVAQLTVVLPPTIAGGPLNVSAPASGSAGFSATVGSATSVTNQWFVNGNLMQTTTGTGLSQFDLASLLSGGNLIAGLATNVPATVLLRASNLAGTSTASATLLVTAGPLPPVITLQPLGVQVDQAQPAQFVVQATGSTPISYRWVRRDGGAIPAGSTGTNSDTFTVNTAATSAVATYYCIITNSVGSVTSAPAGVVMSLPGQGFSVPTVVESPLSQTVSPGATVFLTAAAYANGAIKLQWRGVTNTSSVPPGSQFFQDIPGGTNATLVLSNLQDSARYALRIENPNGAVATAVATITVFRAPRVVSSPVGAVIAIGSSADFSGTIDGGFITYRWLKDGVVVPGPYSGASPASSLRVFANSVTNAGGYSLSGSNSFGSVTTAVAQLTVVLPPVISSGPANVSVPATGSASFSATASSVTAMTYEWFINGNLMQTTTGTGLSQFNLASLLSGGNLVGGLATNVPGTVLFRASNIAGSTTASATILVTPGVSGPVITLHPSSTNMLVGGTLGLAGAAAGTSPLAYQWRFNGTNLAGATNPALTIASISPAQAGPYGLFVSNPYGSVTSLVANVSVSSTTNREVRIAGINPAAGDRINVPVLLRGLGGESSVDFTLGYVGGLVRSIDVVIPPGSPVTNVVRDAGAANAGLLGLHLDFDTNLTATAGERPLVTLTVNCAALQLPAYFLKFSFLDAPRARLLSGGTNALATDWVIMPFAPASAVGNTVMGQSGLFQQSVEIYNPSSLAVASARVYAGGLGNDSRGNPIRLYNATGTDGGVPYIEFGPIPAGSSTVLTLEYYVSDRTTVPNPVITVVFGAGLPATPANFTTPNVDRALFTDGVFLVEFQTQLNRAYYVQYKNDIGSTDWLTSFPGVVGTGSRVQWIDNGPPRTSSSPTNGTRFYRVITPQ